MKNKFVLFIFSIIYSVSFAQGPEYDEWYTLYDDNGLTVKVNIVVVEDKDICKNDNHIPINYRYDGNPLTYSLYQEWEMPILGCNNQPYMVKMSVPLGPELKNIGEEGQEISAEKLETGEFLSRVKKYFDVPNPTQPNSIFNQKVLDNTYVPEKSGKPESIVSSKPGKLNYGESVTLTVDGGYLGQNAEWKWYKNACKSLEIGTGKVLHLSDVKETTTYHVNAVAQGVPPTGCASIQIEVDISSTKPEAISGEEKLCVGEPFELNKVGGVLGPNSKWLWYKGSCSGDTICSGEFYKSDGFEKPGKYTFFLQAMHNEGKTFTECIQKEIVVLSKPNAPKKLIINPVVDVYCEGQEVVLQVDGELDDKSNADWVFVKGQKIIQRSKKKDFKLNLTEDAVLKVYSSNDACAQSESKFKEVKVYKRSLKPSEFIETTSKRKKKLIVSEVYLAEKSDWQWYSKKSGPKKKWKKFNVGSEILLKKSQLPAYFKVRAEGPVCNDTTQFVFSNDNSMISKESKDAKWHMHHSKAKKPATHWGFDLGYDINAYRLPMVDMETQNFRLGNVAGSGGFLAFDFHPLMLEGFTFGLNGNFGLGRTFLQQLTEYSYNDTSYVVDYSYSRAGYGVELGTMISGNKGPMKLIFHWNRNYYLNDYNVQVFPGLNAYTENYSLVDPGLVHDNLGFSIRFGRYSPQNKSRERGINWDFRFNLNRYQQSGDLFSFDPGYFRWLSTWNPGVGLQIWVHRAFKIQLDVMFDRSLEQFFADAAKSGINYTRVGVAYSFDTFR